ncbi:sterol 14alpha-demethylase [Saitoella complicata NRRL Y-17804]|nr:sterol 14alpha-demethylase [Saitoella complicata NRRL Y-17804]ODQ51833.1 sterol 14alpha-demethylase [Saitoella complicata NRRL Y-17804]
MGLVSSLGQYSLFGDSFAGILASLLVAFVIGNVLQQFRPRDKSTPPVVFHLFPWFGSMITYGIDPYKFFFGMREKYGNVYTFIMGGRRITVALGVDGNELVLNGKLSQVSAEDAYTPLTTPVFGEDVVYDVPNHVLMEQKKFVKFGLGIENFKAYVPLIVGETKKYFESSPYFQAGSGKTSGSVPLLKAMSEITIYTASRTLQGKEVRDALDGSFADLYHDLDRGFTPLNFMFPNLPLPSYRRRDVAQKKMAQTYMNIIKKRRETGETPDTDMIWSLMNAKYKDGRALTDKEIAHMMIALLMAGQHTSSATGTWALLHLGADKKLQQDLLEEQKRVCGEDLPELQYEHLKDLTLLNYVIRETLRMHPPLHSIMRLVKAPIQVPGSDIIIPEGHFLMAAPGVTAVDPAHFPNPNTFTADRWSKKSADVDIEEKIDYGYGLVSKGAASPYLPFGAGRHRCIGEQFAYVQLGTLISAFVRELEWESVVPPPDYSSMVVLPAGGSEMRWKLRK